MRKSSVGLLFQITVLTNVAPQKLLFCRLLLEVSVSPSLRYCQHTQAYIVIESSNITCKTKLQKSESVQMLIIENCEDCKIHQSRRIKKCHSAELSPCNVTGAFSTVFRPRLVVITYHKPLLQSSCFVKFRQATPKFNGIVNKLIPPATLIT